MKSLNLSPYSPHNDNVEHIQQQHCQGLVPRDYAIINYLQNKKQDAIIICIKSRNLFYAYQNFLCLSNVTICTIQTIFHKAVQCQVDITYPSEKYLKKQ